MHTIWKFPLTVGAQVIEMPDDATLLTAQMQYRTPMLWAKVNPNLLTRRRRIVVVGTGHAAPDDARYISTFQDGSFVWHVFDGDYE